MDIDGRPILSVVMVYNKAGFSNFYRGVKNTESRISKNDFSHSRTEKGACLILT